MKDSKEAVHDFWNSAPCGLVYAEGEDTAAQLARHAEARYSLEPYILDFAQFEALGRGRDVLEIGVGMGADHMQWARSEPRTLTGVDLTEAAIEFTRQRLDLNGYRSDLRVADAENLPFESESFDTVYSYGVLHHSPDTPQAIREVYRVLRHGGTAKIMIYHSRSLVGAMLWLRYGFLQGRTLGEVYASFLESPGTKAYSIAEAGRMFRESGFKATELGTQLGPGDLLTGATGQRHHGLLLSAMRKVWPRGAIRRWGQGLGLGMLITARK